MKNSLFKIIFICIVLGFILSGCTNTSIIMNSKYKGKDLSSKSMLIMPLSEEAVTIQNKDDVEDDFEEDTREPEIIIGDLVYKTILDNAREYLDGIKLNDSLVDLNSFLFHEDTSKYLSISKSAGNDSILHKFYVPKRELLESNSIKADVVLVINRLYFGRNITTGIPHYLPGTTISTPGGSFQTPGHFVGGGSSQFLGANFEFIIYDYDENDVITYGSTSVKTSFLFAMTRSTWESTFNQIAREVFRKTPFKWTVR